MKYYHFKKAVDENGKHEIHAEDCRYLPEESNRTYLGVFSSCEEALTIAEIKNAPEKFDGCKFCCKNCHTG